MATALPCESLHDDAAAVACRLALLISVLLRNVPRPHSNGVAAGDDPEACAAAHAAQTACIAAGDTREQCASAAAAAGRAPTRRAHAVTPLLVVTRSS